MPRASARKAHHPHHGCAAGSYAPPAGRRRLAEPERYFAAQNAVSGASLAGYNQHPLVSRLGRSGEKTGQTRPRAGRRQPVQVNARINRDGAARQPSPDLGQGACRALAIFSTPGGVALLLPALQR